MENDDDTAKGLWKNLAINKKNNKNEKLTWENMRMSKKNLEMREIWSLGNDWKTKLFAGRGVELW